MRSLVFCALFCVSAPSFGAGEPIAAPAERNPATVRVTAPIDARLTIDGQATRSTSGQRRFVTPPLEVGKRYGYTFRASFLRAGKTITVEQEVFVRAGQETLVSLDAPAEPSGNYSGGNGNASWYGSGDETQAYYGAAEPPAPARAGRYLAPSPGSGSREGRSYSPGFKPIHWGPDPSDPFYHNQH
jgi:uncharacterized protein (TIGR03000 family)